MNFTYNAPENEKWTKINPELETLKKDAQKQGLWNLFLPVDSDKQGNFIVIILLVCGNIILYFIRKVIIIIRLLLYW